MSAPLPPGLPRLVLTVTTGRSGTLLLARALALFRGVTARHEPKPTFSSALRSVCARPEVAREFWLEHKLPRIARARTPVYAETSHVACKGFLESLVELGVAPTLLHLWRAPREVALSLLALGTVPGRTFGGVKYYLAPDDRVFLPLRGDPAELEDYQLCYWYCLEIERRAREYAARFEPAGVRLERVELGSLRSPAGIARLGERLGLAPMGPLARARAARLGRRRWNLRAHKKRGPALAPERLDALEAELRERVEL